MHSQLPSPLVPQQPVVKLNARSVETTRVLNKESLECEKGKKKKVVQNGDIF